MLYWGYKIIDKVFDNMMESILIQNIKNKIPFFISNYQEYWRTKKVKKDDMILEASDIANKV